jgi:transposase InsO family protein
MSRKNQRLSFAEKSIIVRTALEGELSRDEICEMFNVRKPTLNNWLKIIDHNIEYLEKLKSKRSILPASKNPSRGLAEWVKKEIDSLLIKHPTWGALKFREYFFRHCQELISQKDIYFCLKDSGVIEARRKRKSASTTHNRRFEFDGPLDAVQCDLLQLTLVGGEKAYLMTFIDDYSRYILNSQLMPTKSMDFVIPCLLKTIRQHGVMDRLITDKGSEFVSWKSFTRFEQTLNDWDVELIASGPDKPQCQGKIERWHKTLREDFEDVYGPFTTVVEAQGSLNRFLAFYNFERPSEALGGLVPADRFYGLNDELVKALSHCRDTDERIYFTCNIGGKKLVVCGPKHGNVSVFINGKEELNNGKEIIRK